MQTEAGKLPSPVVTGTYFIDEPTTLPVVSVIAHPCDLFNDGPGCIAAYDNAEGWFNRNPKVSVAVEYYDQDHVKQFGDNYKFECVGNYSISLPQKVCVLLAMKIMELKVILPTMYLNTINREWNLYGFA